MAADAMQPGARARETVDLDGMRVLSWPLNAAGTWDSGQLTIGIGGYDLGIRVDKAGPLTRGVQITRPIVTLPSFEIRHTSAGEFWIAPLM
ncbi:MAG: hypothetical protein EXR07_08950 [Acetobacteraceae bacterium]|nr:hypothetical protein [Acetobacteraceae bacterium]